MEHLTKETFKDKIFDFENNKEWNYKGEKPAIIDFYADWCGPCKMMEPTLEQIEHEYQGQLNIYKVDTQEQAELAKMFGIQSVPSILFIPMNGDPQMAGGTMSKNLFEKAINEILMAEAN